MCIRDSSPSNQFGSAITWYNLQQGSPCFIRFIVWRELIIFSVDWGIQALALSCFGLGICSTFPKLPLSHWFYQCNRCLLLSPATWGLMARFHASIYQPWEQTPSRSWVPIGASSWISSGTQFPHCNSIFSLLFCLIIALYYWTANQILHLFPHNQAENGAAQKEYLVTLNIAH